MSCWQLPLLAVGRKGTECGGQVLTKRLLLEGLTNSWDGWTRDGSCLPLQMSTCGLTCWPGQIWVSQRVLPLLGPPYAGQKHAWRLGAAWGRKLPRGLAKGVV